MRHGPKVLANDGHAVADVAAAGAGAAGPRTACWDRSRTNWRRPRPRKRRKRLPISTEYRWNRQAHSLLQNRDGNYVAPTSATFQAAAANADWEKAEGFYLVLTDQPGAESWPITGASFILVYKEQANAETAKEVLKFFDWCYRKGGKTAEKLDYVPMPEKVVALVEKVWKEQVKTAGKPVWP